MCAETGLCDIEYGSNQTASRPRVLSTRKQTATNRPAEQLVLSSYTLPSPTRLRESRTTSELDRHALTLDVPLEVGQQLKLLGDSEAADDRLQNGSDGNVVLTDEAAVIDVCEHAHEEPVKMALA